MNKFASIAGKAKRVLISACISPFTRHTDQAGFAKGYAELKALYLKETPGFDYGTYVVPAWQDNTDRIESIFLNDFPFSFLRQGVLKKTMFIHSVSAWRNIQKKLLKEYFPEAQLRELLIENSLGKPLLSDWEMKTSGNTIHHAYHLALFFKKTKIAAHDVNTVVEVGGGYGNMARLFKKLNPAATYVIIDIPIFSYIQAAYLRALLGMDAVHVITHDDQRIAEGKINIWPLSENTNAALRTSIPRTDLFLSTWAISESNIEMQNLVRNLDWFNAAYVLLAYQKSNADFVDAENASNLSDKFETVFQEETEYAKDSYYLFAKLRP